MTKIQKSKIEKIQNPPSENKTTSDQPLVNPTCAIEHLPKFDKLQDAQKLSNGVHFLLLKSQLINIGEPDRISKPGELSSEKTSENVPVINIDRDGEINQGNTREHFFSKEKYLKVFFGDTDSRFNENLGKNDTLKSYIWMVRKSAIKNKISDAIQNSIKFKQFMQAAEYVLLAYRHISTKLTLGVIRELKEEQILEIPAIALSTADVFHKEIKFFESLDDKRLVKFKKSISEMDNKSSAQIYGRINKYKQPAPGKKPTTDKPTTDKPKSEPPKKSETVNPTTDKPEKSKSEILIENENRIELMIDNKKLSITIKELRKLIGLKEAMNPKDLNLEYQFSSYKVYSEIELEIKKVYFAGMLIGKFGLYDNYKEAKSIEDINKIVDAIFGKDVQ